MKRALLLLDLQFDFLDPHGRLPIALEQVGPLLSAVNSAVARADHDHDPVIAIGNEFHNGDFVSNLLRHYAAMQGSVGARWDSRAPRGGAGYFSKSTGDAFSNPKLAAYLKDLKITDLVLCGVYASECILRTTRGGMAQGYKVEVLAPGVGDASTVARMRAISKLRRMGVKIIDQY